MAVQVSKEFGGSSTAMNADISNAFDQVSNSMTNSLPASKTVAAPVASPSKPSNLLNVKNHNAASSSKDAHKLDAFIYFG